MNHLNRIAASLEDAGIVNDTLIPDDPNVANPLVDETEELQAGVDLLANLESIYDISRRMLESGNISQESAQMLQFIASDVMGMSSEELELNKMSFESYTTPEAYHARMNLAMEGMLANIPGRLAEKFKTTIVQYGVIFASSKTKIAKINKRLEEIRDKLYAEFDETKFEEFKFGEYNGQASVLVAGKFPADLGKAFDDTYKAHSLVIEAADKCISVSEEILNKLSTVKSDEEMVEYLNKLEHPLIGTGLSEEGVSCVGSYRLAVKKSDKRVVSGMGDIASTHKVVNPIEKAVQTIASIAVKTIPFIGRDKIDPNMIKSSLDATIKNNQRFLAAISSTKVAKNEIHSKIVSSSTKAKENGISPTICNQVSSIVSNLVATSNKSVKTLSSRVGKNAFYQVYWWTELANRTTTLDEPKQKLEKPFDFGSDE